MFFRKVAHKELLDPQSARIPPRQTNQKSVRAGASREASGFRIEKKPFLRIFKRGARFVGNGFVARARKQFKRCAGGFCKLRGGEPVSNRQVFAEMIRSDACSEEPAERIFLAGCSNPGGPRRHGPRWPQCSEPCEFIGSGSHLSTQPVEDGQCSFFCAWSEIARRADAGGTTLFAGARGDEFARFLH